MITYIMCKEFYKSGEFSEVKNPYAGFEIILRVPVFLVLDILLTFKIISLFI